MHETSTLKINCVLFTKLFSSFLYTCPRLHSPHRLYIHSLIKSNLNNKIKQIMIMAIEKRAHESSNASFSLTSFWSNLCVLWVRSRPSVRSMRCQRQGCLKHLSYIFIVIYTLFLVKLCVCVWIHIDSYDRQCVRCVNDWIACCATDVIVAPIFKCFHLFIVLYLE